MVFGEQQARHISASSSEVPHPIAQNGYPRPTSSRVPSLPLAATTCRRIGAPTGCRSSPPPSDECHVDESSPSSHTRPTSPNPQEADTHGDERLPNRSQPPAKRGAAEQRGVAAEPAARVAATVAAADGGGIRTTCSRPSSSARPRAARGARACC